MKLERYLLFELVGGFVSLIQFLDFREQGLTVFFYPVIVFPRNKVLLEWNDKL